MCFIGLCSLGLREPYVRPFCLSWRLNTSQKSRQHSTARQLFNQTLLCFWAPVQHYKTSSQYWSVLVFSDLLSVLPSGPNPCDLYITAENLSNKSQPIFSRLYTCSSGLVPVCSVSIKMLFQSPEHFTLGELCTLVFPSCCCGSQSPLSISLTLLDWHKCPPFHLFLVCLQPIDGVQRTILECLSLTHALGLQNLHVLCKRWVKLLYKSYSLENEKRKYMYFNQNVHCCTDELLLPFEKGGHFSPCHHFCHCNLTAKSQLHLVAR